MLFQLICYPSKLHNECRKYFVVMQVKIIQPPPSAILNMYIFAPVLKSPFYSDFAPEG